MSSSSNATRGRQGRRGSKDGVRERIVKATGGGPSRVSRDRGYSQGEGRGIARRRKLGSTVSSTDLDAPVTRASELLGASPIRRLLWKHEDDCESKGKGTEARNNGEAGKRRRARRTEVWGSGQNQNGRKSGSLLPAHLHFSSLFCANPLLLCYFASAEDKQDGGFSGNYCSSHTI